MMAHAQTLEEVLHLLDTYDVKALGRRTQVSPQNFNLNPDEHSTWYFDNQLPLRSVFRRTDGWVELDIEKRYLLMEPFDFEVRSEGFVVWNATDFRVGGHVGANGSELEDFVEPSPDRRMKVDEGAPITGIVVWGQFPLVEHGWGRLQSA